MGKKGEKLNDYNPKELEKLNERVDALAELLGDLEGRTKKVEEKSYPGDIANTIREGFANLIATILATPAVQRPSPAERPVSAPAFQFDIFSVGWKIKGSEPAPANPKWGWAFAYNQDGGYHPETAKLVKYLEAYKVYDAEGYTVKLGGRDNKLLQLNKK